MKYLSIILSAAFIILLVCYVICKRQVAKYETIIDTHTTLKEDIIPLDSLERLAAEVKKKNKQQRLQDLDRIDSLCLHIQEDQFPGHHNHNEAYSYQDTLIIIKDTVIYNHIPKDTLVYIVKYVTDTIYRQIEIVDTLYKKVKLKRKK